MSFTVTYRENITVTQSITNMYLHNPHLRRAKCENTIDGVEVCPVSLCLLNAFQKKKKSLKSARNKGSLQGIHLTSHEDAKYFCM